MKHDDKLTMMETCTNCGVVYCPEIKSLTVRAEEFLAETQKNYLLDAIADAAAEPEQSG